MKCSRPCRPAVIGFVALCLSLFVFIGSFDIRSPGLYHDEALFVNAATGGASELFVYRRLAGIPVMLMPYVGALKAWLYFPVFELFGIDLVTIRLPAVLFGALALGLTGRYVQQQFGRLAAAFFLLMAAVEPGMVFHSRLDWGPTALMMVFRGGLLLALTNWLASGERRHLLWALLCVGLGLFDKLNFVWIASSAFAAALLLHPDRFFRAGRSGYRRLSIGLVLALAALLLFAAALNALGIRPIDEIGIPDLHERTDVFRILLGQTLRGSGVYDFVTGQPLPAFDVQGRVLVAASLVATGGLIAGLRRGFLPARRLLFLVLTMLFLGIQIFLTRKAAGPHHFATLAPLWLILLAVGLAAAVRALQGQGWILAAALGGLCVALVMASSLRLDLACLAAFRQERINPHWDPASSVVLSSALQAQPGTARVVAVDWGMATNLQALSGNRLQVMDFWSFFIADLNEEQLTWMRRTFVDQGAAFVLHVAGRETLPGTRRRFLDAMTLHGWPLRRVLTINTADGQPYIEVYRAVEAQP